MFHNPAALIILVIFYFFLAIIVLSPTLYAAWFYFLSRDVPGKKKALLRTALITFAINLIVACVAIKMAYDLLVPPMIAEKDASAVAAIRSAVQSQGKHFSIRGRYYSVGPVKGPYSDEYGLKIEKDVILLVEPLWDKAAGKEAFEAHAVNIWGGAVLLRAKDGHLAPLPADSEEASRMREKLVRSAM